MKSSTALLMSREESLTEIFPLPLSSCLIYYRCSPCLLLFSPLPHTFLLIFAILFREITIFVWTPSGKRLRALSCHESEEPWQKVTKVSKRLQLVILYHRFSFAGLRPFPGDLQTGYTGAQIWDGVCKKPHRLFNRVFGGIFKWLGFQ